MWPPEPLPPLPLSLPQAIARMEGWYARGDVPNRPQRNNNPGNMNFGPYAETLGAVLETDTPHPRFACFATPEDGWKCLAGKLSSPSYSGLTVQQAINKWAPPTENETNQYIALVLNWTTLEASTLVRDALL